VGDDVQIDYDDLKELRDYLEEIVEELDKASDRADELEDAIGDPMDKDDLREAAEEFEDGWDDRRGELKEDLEKIHEHVKAVIEGFEEWDRDTSDSMEPE
jgi:predicted  nucleic acid-binding Zn-ribbon protein